MGRPAPPFWTAVNKLRPYDESLWTEDEYNDAIVNIFTRLNTAGRTLTREEITFAWLKVGWDDAATGGKTAGDCFEALLKVAQDKGLPIQMDDLVRAVSFIWAVAYRNGELLSDKDLLKGDTVRPMANDLAAAWKDIVQAIETVLDTARDRDLRYGQNGQYNSLNALNILWCWSFLANRWLTQNKQKVLEEDSYEKTISASLDLHIDRWVICSHWAGRWGASSGTVLAGYAKDLNGDHVALNAAADAKSALKVSADRLKALVNGIATDAVAYSKEHSVDRREQVSRYNTLLWIWHRLDNERWVTSSVQLRSGRRKKCDLEVDHTVAHGLWETMVKALPPNDDDHEKELMQTINNLGNCTLLEKTFNISKSDKPLKHFLEEVHEIKDGKIKVADWTAALDLKDCLLDPNNASVQEIADAIAERDSGIRTEVVDFVQGTRSRHDLSAAQPAAAN